MGFNFPDSPINGMPFAPVGGPEYIYSNGAWIQVEGIAGPVTGAKFFDYRQQAIDSPIANDIHYITLAGYSSPGDGGGAMYVRASVEPVHQGKFRSADGAWWELIAPVELTLEMFGGRADGKQLMTQPAGVTDNWDAFMAALDFWAYPPGPGIPAGSFSAGPSIRLLRGIYYVSKTVEVDRCVRISGSGGAPLSNSVTQSIVVFPMNVMGFRFWVGGVYDPALGDLHRRSAIGTVFENITVQGYGGVREPVGGVGGDLTKHGLKMYCMVQVRECHIINFAGNGIDVDGLGDARANLFYFQSVRVTQSGGHGIFVDGSNANAGGGIHIDSTGNGGWGIWDSSWFSNVWTSCHTRDNGIRARVSHNGNAYFYIYHLPNNRAIPGTTPAAAVWELLAPSGAYPGWPAWSETGTYISGGPYSTMVSSPGTNSNSGIVFVSPYVEGGQGPCRFTEGTIAIGGGQGVPYVGEGASQKVFAGNIGQIINATGTDGAWNVRMNIVNTDIPGATIRIGTTDTAPIKIIANGDGQGLDFPIWNTTTGTYDIRQGIQTDSMVKFTSDLTTGVDVGRTAKLAPGNILFPSDIFVGPDLANCRLITNSTTVPSAFGAFARGDIAFNRTPVAGGKVGWICVQGGMLAATAAWAINTNPTSYVQHGGNFYQLVFYPQANLSLAEPAHTPSRIGPADANGYVWTYAYTGINTVPVWTSQAYALDALVRSTSADSVHRYDVYRCSTVGTGVSITEPNHPATETLVDQEQWEFLFDPTTISPWVSQTYKVGAIVSNGGGDYVRVRVAGPAASTIIPYMYWPSITAFSDGYTWEYLASPWRVNNWVFGKVYSTSSGYLEHQQRVKNAATGNFYAIRAIRGVAMKTSTPPVHTSGTAMATDFYKWLYVDNKSPIWKPFGLIDS